MPGIPTGITREQPLAADLLMDALGKEHDSCDERAISGTYGLMTGDLGYYAVSLRALTA